MAKLQEVQMSDRQTVNQVVATDRDNGNGIEPPADDQKPSAIKPIITDEKEAPTVATASLFVFGLSIFLHSFLDGLAIGVFSEVGEMAVLAATVIIHKIPVAYTVGTTFLTQKQPLLKWTTIGFFILFVLSTPIGIIIGANVSSSGGLAIVIVQSIAGGCFIYLACCDFLIHEFHKGQDIAPGDIRDVEAKTKTLKCVRLIKFAFVFSGFLIITLLFTFGKKHEH